MSWLIDRLLGLDHLSWSQVDTRLDWRYPLPAWAWALIVLAAAGMAGWSYNRLHGPGLGRVILTVIRSVLLVAVAMILAGPILVLNREEVEQDWLLMLVDRSASMTIEDALLDSNDTQDPVSRDRALLTAIKEQAQWFEPDKIGRDHQLKWFGFDELVYPIDPPYDDSGDGRGTGAPAGRSTALRAAIEQSLVRAAGRPVSGIVLFTDGRSHQNTGADLVRRLKQQGVSVFPVPLGGSLDAVDLSLSRVDAPDRAFVNDRVPVTVWVDRYPVDADVDPHAVRVRLVDAQTGQTLDEATAGDQGLAEPIRLAGQSGVAGPAAWRVELTYDPPGHATTTTTQTPRTKHRELISENNERHVRVELIDRPIRVLYVEGYPRWEYRYLQGVLAREKSIESSVLLISSDQAFVQEGDLPIGRLPRDSGEWRMFDVVILGDVPSDYLSLQQRAMLRDRVASGGAGLLWIGGGYHTPYSYETTQLAELLPMKQPGMVEPIEWSRGPMAAKPTELARALSLFILDEEGAVGPDEFSDSINSHWPKKLPGLTWAQAVGVLKPSADVLMTASLANQGSTVPLVLRLRYGAGQVLYVATDDTWRWRYGRGDLYFQRFWLQLIRMLGRQSIRKETGRAQLRISHPRVELNQAVVVELQLEDAALLERDLPRVVVSVTAPGQEPASTDRAGRVVEQIELLPVADESAGIDESGRDGSQSVYRAIWRPTSGGRLALRVVEPVLSDLDNTVPIEVIYPDDELRHPMPDHARLGALAQQTGGQLVPLDRMQDLVRLIPNRARRTPNDVHESLWDSLLALIAVMLLLTVEWVGRKMIRLA